jgi:hypothetical protein
VLRTADATVGQAAKGLRVVGEAFVLYTAGHFIGRAFAPKVHLVLSQLRLLCGCLTRSGSLRSTSEKQRKKQNTLHGFSCIFDSDMIRRNFEREGIDEQAAQNNFFCVCVFVVHFGNTN